MALHLAREREIARVLARNGLELLLAASGLPEQHPRMALLRGLVAHGARDQGLTRPEIVRQTLEQLGPTFVKMAQVLATRRDLVPPAFAAELAKLHDRMTPIPAARVRAVIEAELGVPVERVFASFDDEPVGSASLGQVHNATLRDGREVVVKVLRPGIEAVVEADLAILAEVATNVARVSDTVRGLDLPGFVAEFDRQLHVEMDYRAEGRNAERIAKNFAGRRGLHVPAIHWAHTTRRVLTMERLTGIKASDVESLDAAGIDRPALGRRASRIVLDMVLVDGFFHADPHPGNLFIEPDGTIGLVDYGMVGELGPAVQAQLIEIVTAFAARDAPMLSDAVLAFAPPVGGVDRIRLNRAVDRLIRSYVGKPLADTNMVTIVNGLLDLIRTHRLRPPTEISLIARMLALLDAIGRSLDPDYSMVEILQPYIETLLARRLTPDAVWAGLVALASDSMKLGRGAPRRLLRILSRYEQEGVRVALDADTLEPYMRRFEQLGDRLLAAYLLGAAIKAVGSLGATDDRVLIRFRGPLLVAGTGMAGVLTTYLLRTARHRPRP